MKKFGLVLAMLVLGFVVSATFLSCDNGSTGGSGGIPAALVAKWYGTQAQANAGGSDWRLEITSDGRHSWGPTSSVGSCSVSGNTLNLNSNSGITHLTYSFTISGTELTLVRAGSGSTAGTTLKYYKKAN